jgi:hypothetical protein
MLVFTSMVLFFGIFIWLAFKLKTKSVVHNKAVQEHYGSFA